MELFIDSNTIKTLKPLGIAALGVAAVFTIAYTFNKFLSEKDQQQEQQQEVQIQKNKPAGIYNQGNTCFVNSLLQALAPLKSFITNIEQLTQFSDGKISTNEQLLIQLKKTLLKINKESQSVQISNFLRCISNFSQIINMQQQDAYELFSIIVNCLENVQNQNKSINLCRSTLSADDDDELEETFVNCSASVRKQESNRNTLLGYTKSSIICQGCKQEINIKIHPFYNLSFDISLKRVHTLEDAINHFQEKQYIEDWVCTHCSLLEHLKKLAHVRQELQQKKPLYSELMIEICNKIEKFLVAKSHNELQIHEVNKSLGAFVKNYEKQYLEIGEKNQYRDRVFVEILPVTRTIVKQCVISKFPKILALHLKQLSINPLTGEPMLLRKRIGFPKNLKIEVKKGSKNYELVSLIAHSGNQSFGHYFTFRKLNSGTQNWFFISDTQSLECKQSFLQVHMPYMLFYQLVQQQ